MPASQDNLPGFTFHGPPTSADSTHPMSALITSPVAAAAAAQEVMFDPVMAADGFCYEAAAIRRWLQDGHRSSPMTNAPLRSPDLIRNHALRSAIADYRATSA